MEKDIILKMEHITKIFPGVKALDDVSLEIRRERYCPSWEKMVQENQH